MKEKKKVKLLAKEFGIKVKRSTSTYKGVHQVELKNGQRLCLKKISYPIKRLRWIDSVLQQIRQEGFGNLAWRNAQKSYGKKLFVRLDPKSPPYALMPWIKGRWPNPLSLEDMKRCGETLAHFHLAGKSIKPEAEKSVNKLQTWTGELEGKKQLLAQKIKSAIQHEKKSGLAHFFNKNQAEILQYATQSSALLASSPYQEECRKPYTQVCHGDGGPSNFIFTSSQVYLIDFETLRLDLPAYDLYRVIYNSCKDYGWNFAIAEAILNGYHSVVKLKPIDLELAKVWLRFPRTIELLFKKWPKTAHQKRKLLKQYKRALGVERKMGDFLSRLDQYGEKLKPTRRLR
ncbi:phosphotransferase [Bacillus horti]|uniref:CotS family spore coat protein n=1 Tax=Caldalkalibacillus horti TaxID=77523 RepID=A0ABT9VXT1_9BACI|nr:phosphotransferase [Bacillus horti]MDQ0165783.1 CotS family spore coat protein [Bacillus horti]